jgi:hypothetical protein
LEEDNFEFIGLDITVTGSGWQGKFDVILYFQDRPLDSNAVRLYIRINHPRWLVSRFVRHVDRVSGATKMPEKLSDSERSALLKIARQTLEAAVRGEPLPELNRADLPPSFLEPGAVFVTLTRRAARRGG